MSDLIDRQAAITQLSHNKHKGDEEWELAVANDIQTIWKLPPAQLGTNLAEVGTDTISRRAAIDAIEAEKIKHGNYLTSSYVGYEMAEKVVKQLSPIQPEITHEQAVEYLQSTGWMQEHDRQMMLDGVHRLTAQPEIVRCKDCKYARLTNDGSCKYCDIWFPDEAEYMDGDYYCASAERRTDE